MLGTAGPQRFEPRIGRELDVELARSTLALELGVMRAGEVRGKLRGREQPWRLYGRMALNRHRRGHLGLARRKRTPRMLFQIIVPGLSIPRIPVGTQQIQMPKAPRVNKPSRIQRPRGMRR